MIWLKICFAKWKMHIYLLRSGMFRGECATEITANHGKRFIVCTTIGEKIIKRFYDGPPA